MKREGAEEDPLQVVFNAYDSGLLKRRHLYFDKAGGPISLAEWDALFSNQEYKQIARTETEEYVISTIWMGMDHNHASDGPPLIFETMVFHRDDVGGEELWCALCATEQEAIVQHEEVVAKFTTVKKE